jgi:hypothetical protein
LRVSTHTHSRYCCCRSHALQVNCTVAEDCARKTGQPLPGLTCGGVEVGCVQGVCASTTAKGMHNKLCYKPTAPAPPPTTRVDGKSPRTCLERCRYAAIIRAQTIHSTN